MTPSEAARTALIDLGAEAQNRVDAFSREYLRTRGGRLGSGMGSLMEALWCFHMNAILAERDLQFELLWLYENEYNDFLCVARGIAWSPADRAGEILGIEAKSMNTAAGEPKAHFDQIVERIGEDDLLLVLVWKWVLASDLVYCPQIVDHFIGPARSVANLRDRLHEARGGTFIGRGATCPDHPYAAHCEHVGEPLNRSGNRERRSGPISARGSGRTGHAQNFGGLVRMLKTRGGSARAALIAATKDDIWAAQYVDFINRHISPAALPD